MNKFFTTALLAISFTYAVPSNTYAEQSAETAVEIEPTCTKQTFKEKACVCVDQAKQICTEHPYLVAGTAASVALLIACLIDMGKGQNESYLRTWINGTPHGHVELRTLMARLNRQEEPTQTPTQTED